MKNALHSLPLEFCQKVLFNRHFVCDLFRFCLGSICVIPVHIKINSQFIGPTVTFDHVHNSDDKNDFTSFSRVQINKSTVRTHIHCSTIILLLFVTFVVCDLWYVSLSSVGERSTDSVLERLAQMMTSLPVTIVHNADRYDNISTYTDGNNHLNYLHTICKIRISEIFNFIFGSHFFRRLN